MSAIVISVGRRLVGLTRVGLTAPPPAGLIMKRMNCWSRRG
jgi:hypothetical protein